MTSRNTCTPRQWSLWIPCSLLAATALVFGAGRAAAATESEQKFCASRATAEDRKTCLREAAAARAEARRGQLKQRDADYERNAMQRCEALPAADQEACRSRVRGEGHVSGSVEGGGLYRETREIIPAEEPQR